MSQIAPGNPFAERSRQTYDEIVAQPKVNAIGHRSGERYAEESLGWIPSVSAGFVGGVSATPGVIEVQEAGQANGRGRLGSGQQVPSWDHIDFSMRRSFATGTSGEPGHASPFAPTGRPGNTNTLSPTSGLQRGERPNTRIVHACAVPGRGRRNSADISEL